MSDNLLQKIRSADNFPSLPTVAVEVLRLSRTEDASIDDLVKVIQQDPALTGKILKTVNSALFCIPREIGSLKQAVGLLGLRSVKVMALSFSLADTLHDDKEEGFDFKTFWRRSLSSAAAARLIAQAVIPEQAEEAFVSGLLSDLAIVAAWRCAPELYQPVLSAWYADSRDLAEIETEQLGVTHAQLGRELLNTWSLPDKLCEAVGAHHGEGLDELPQESRKLAQVVYAAATIAGLFCQDFPSGMLDQVIEDCCTGTGIDEARLEKILKTLDKRVRETASMLSVPVGETIDYVKIQTEAAAQLAQLSMQAEVERRESSSRELEAKSEVSRLHNENKVILEAASTDSLTKIANRAAFDKRLDEELDRARVEKHSLSLIMMDLDHFKQFNDTYGHQTGDEVLRHVAMCINDVLEHTGFVARYGGEEFVVIVAQKTARQVHALAEEIRCTIDSRLLKRQEQELHVTASLGAVCMADPSPSVTSEELIEQADRQLYRAKRAGRNRVEM
jgi:two-component system cell cycle response regulator